VAVPTTLGLELPRLAQECHAQQGLDLFTQTSQAASQLLVDEHGLPLGRLAICCALLSGPAPSRVLAATKVEAQFQVGRQGHVDLSHHCVEEALRRQAD
jgi:hypothetical protein